MSLLKKEFIGFPLIFPLRKSRHIKLKSEQIYESLIKILSDSVKAEVKVDEKKLFMEAKLEGALGATVKINIFPEGEVCDIDIAFFYTRFAMAASSLLIGTITICLILWSLVPLIGNVFSLILGYGVNSSILTFLNNLYRALPYIERDYARKALLKDRERWKGDPRNETELYRKICKKHMKNWGNINVLEYKVTYLESQGLTRKEAIRKVAEDEGVIKK